MQVREFLVSILKQDIGLTSEMVFGILRDPDATEGEARVIEAVSIGVADGVVQVLMRVPPAPITNEELGAAIDGLPAEQAELIKKAEELRKSLISDLQRNKSAEALDGILGKTEEPKLSPPVFPDNPDN